MTQPPRFNIMPALLGALGPEAASYGIDIGGGPAPTPSVRPVMPYVPPASARPDLPVTRTAEQGIGTTPIQTSNTPVTTTTRSVPDYMAPLRGVAPLDLTQVPAYPTYPTAPKYGQQPTINQGQVAREQGRASLRAGLIGLLLGGGMGALSGAVGAAQGVQQGVETEYQRRQQEINAQNQLLAQDYQARMGQYGAEVAQRQAALNEAIARQAQRQNELNALYEQSRDVYTRGISEQDAAQRRIEAEATRRVSMLNALGGLTPETQPAGVEFLRTGVLPEGGLKKAVRPSTAGTITPVNAPLILSRTINNFTRTSKDPAAWSRTRDSLISAFKASDDPTVRAMAAMVPNEMPKDMRQIYREQLDRATANRNAARDAAQQRHWASQEDIARKRLRLDQESNNLQAERERRLAAGKPTTSEQDRYARRLINEGIDDIQKLHAQLASGEMNEEEHNRSVDSAAARIQGLYNQNPSLFTGPLYDANGRLQYVTLRSPGATAPAPAAASPSGLRRFAPTRVP